MGYLVVGVSADTYLFGARDPFTGGIQGFDIDMARAVAKAIFGDPSKLQLRVITAADRIPLLQDRSVDMVARNLSMTCGRWNDIAFSAEYYRSGQKVLVSKALPGAKDLSLADLKGKRVCAPTGTTSLTKLQQVKVRSSSPPARTPAASCSSSRARPTPSPVTTPCSPGSPHRTPTP